MSVPLALDAELTLSTAHGDVVVYAEGGQITLDVQDLHTLKALMHTGPGRPPWRVRLERLRPWLLVADLTIDLRLCGHTVARLGAQALPNFLGYALQLGPVELKPFAMLQVWWHSRRHAPIRP